MSTVLSTVMETFVDIAVIFDISTPALDDILTYRPTLKTLVSDTKNTILFPGATVGEFVYARVIDVVFVTQE